MTGRDGALEAVPKVAAVVVNWNGGDVVGPCLQSLLAAPYERLDVVVVDNGSTDDSADVIGRFASVRMLQNAANVGYARACNRGIRETESDYVLLLNNDTVVDRPSVLRAAVSYMEDHPDAGALGVRLRNPDGSLQISCGRFPSLEAELRNSVPARILLGRAPRPLWYSEGEHEQTAAVDWVMGAFLLVRRAALDDAGLLDESGFMYYEDCDLSYRLRQRGWRTYFLASTSIMHRLNWSGSRAFSDEERAIRVHRAERALVARHHGPVYAWTYSITSVLDRWTKVLVAMLLRRRPVVSRLAVDARARTLALLAPKPSRDSE